jgi:hemerythrin superfamily protein
MNAIKLLQEQHREVEQLFKQFEEAQEDAQALRKLFIEVADALEMHATIEERHFYPGVKTDETKAMLNESVQEHLSVRRIIADLLDLNPRDERFSAGFKTLMEQVEHHVHEEEVELFPKVLSAFSEEELEKLGALMENTLAELMAEGEPHEETPSRTGLPPRV